ncbi:MAG: hypothetical protein GY856_42540 [bacterium]|nr:hypothetical protein [bacterium]
MIETRLWESTTTPSDALFARRTAVRDSHDRQANVEVHYLLQRIAILATNLKGNLDTAVARRLQVIVEFPFPGIAERERIWRRIWRRLSPERVARARCAGRSGWWDFRSPSSP